MFSVRHRNRGFGLSRRGALLGAAALLGASNGLCAFESELPPCLGSLALSLRLRLGLRPLPVDALVG